MPACDVCKKTSEEPETPLQRCSRCKKRVFCGGVCQASDWPQHKLGCGRVWYDKHRKCRDGNKHEGELELITWNSENDDTEIGWDWLCFVNPTHGLDGDSKSLV